MTSSKRHALIVSSLRAKGAASVRELAETLKVSESTIRRDLDLLDRDGELVRNYGGAAPAPRPAVPEISFAASADRVVLVASEAEFPGTGSLRVCSLAQVDALVTTAGADPATLEHCRRAGGEVHLA